MAVPEGGQVFIQKGPKGTKRKQGHLTSRPMISPTEPLSNLTTGHLPGWVWALTLGRGQRTVGGQNGTKDWRRGSFNGNGQNILYSVNEESGGDTKKRLQSELEQLNRWKPAAPIKGR